MWLHHGEYAQALKPLTWLKGHHWWNSQRCEPSTRAYRGKSMADEIYITDRLCLSTYRTPESPPLLAHTSQAHAIRHHPSHCARRRSASHSSTLRRSCTLAIRTLPLPRPTSQFRRCIPLRRPPTMLSCNMSRDARLGMAVPLRCARSPESMLRH